jgi:hypothetical protein
MNVRGQSSLMVFFILVILGIVYFVGLAGMVGSLAAQAAFDGNLIGFEGWFYSNINFIITIGYIISLMAVGYYAR